MDQNLSAAMLNTRQHPLLHQIQPGEQIRFGREIRVCVDG